MGEEQQMLKKQARLTETLSDRKRRDGEERKEDENKCVKEAREGDRRELLKEKRLSAEENMTHMEKQTRELEEERKREVESQLREELRERKGERKHEEDMKIRKLEDTERGEILGKMRELEEMTIKMERQHAEKTAMEKEERKRVEDTVGKKKVKKIILEVWEFHFGSDESSESDDSESEETPDSDTAIVKTTEKVEKENSSDEMKDNSVGVCQDSDTSVIEEINMKKDMVDKDNTDNNVGKEKTTQNNEKKEEGERKEGQSQDTETYKTDGATESDELTLTPGKGSDSNDCESVKSNQVEEEDDQKDKGELESQEERKEDRILPGVEGETQHPQEDQSETSKDFSIFDVAEVKTQDPDEDQPEKVKDSSIFSAGAEVKQTQCKDVSMVTATESKTLNPQKDQPAKYKEFSVYSTGSRGVAKVPQVLQVKVSNKSESVQKKDGNDKVTAPKTDAELLMDKFERIAEEERIWPCQKDRRDKDQAKEIEGKRKEEEVLSKEEQRRLRNEKALQEHLDRVKNPEMTGKQTRQPQCKDYSIFTASGLKSKDPHDQQSAKCKDLSIFSADAQTQQCKDVSMVTATASRTLKAQEDNPAMCKAGGKTQNSQTDQAAKVKGEQDLTSGGINQEKTEIEVLQRSRQEQLAKCKDFSVFSTSSQGVAKVPQFLQVKVSKKSESVQKKDGNDKVTDPKTVAELIMDKYEGMAEEGRRGPCQKDRRDKDQAKEIEGKRKEEVLSKEEQRRLRNEKALQEHLDRVERTGKQTRQRRLRNEKALQAHRNRVENQEGTGKQTRQPQCKDYSIFTASGLKSKDPHDQQSAKCKDLSIFSADAQTQQCKDVSMVTATASRTLKAQEDNPAMCKAGGKTQNTQTDQAAKVKGEQDLTSGGINQEKTEIEVLQRSRQEQLAKCKDFSVFSTSSQGVAKVPQFLQVKVSKKSESVQKKDGNDKVTDPKTVAELIMDKYEGMAEEGRRGPCQNDRRDKDQAKEIEGKRKEEEVLSKEEQRRLRNEKALQEHLDRVERTGKQTRQRRLRNEKALQAHRNRVENQEGTGKQTRQPQCKDYSIFTASGLKSKDPHDQQSAKCKDVSMVTATASRTLKAQEDNPAMCKAGGKTQNTQTDQAAKVKGEQDLTSGGINQEKTEIEVLQRSRQEQLAKCKEFSVFSTGSRGVAKVPQVLQVKVSNKSESVQKKDGNDKVTAPKTDAELLMDKFERIAEEERIWPCQKDRRDKDQAKEIEGKRKEEEVLSKEEQRRLRNEKALQEHLDRVKNPEMTGKQTRQPQCKDYSIFTASGLKSKDPHDQQSTKCKDLSIFSADAQTQQCKDVSMVTATASRTLKAQEDNPAMCKAGGKTQNNQTDQAAKVKGEQDLDIDTDWSESDYDSDDVFLTDEIWQKRKEDYEKKRQNNDDTVTALPNTDRIDGEISREKSGKINQEQMAAVEGKTQNPQTEQPVKVKGENDLTSGGINQEKTEIEVLQRSRQEQLAKCKDFSVFSTSSQGVAKVPQVLQVKVSNKSESVQKKDGNAKVTAPKTDAELLMDKFERMAEEERIWPCRKDRRDKDQAKEIEGKRKEEEVLSKEEQRRLRNEKALQEHLDRVKRTGKQTRQPQCKDYSIFTASGLKSKDPHDQQSAKCKDFSVFSTSSQGVAKVPQFLQVKVSKKSEIVQKKDGNDKVTAPKTDAELLMDKFERMAEEERIWPCRKDRRDKDQAKEIEGKRKEEEVLSKEEQRRLRNEKALQEHLDRVENQEGTGKQTRQPQCKDYSIFTASGLKSKDPHDQQSAKCKDVSMVTATESKTLNPQKDQPAKSKAGKNRFAKFFKTLVCRKTKA
ncbi:trichohyalin isoform X4 [Coregonus clupeaformis]|uniref:trichohyalin isoform X4 n=1 Tax=Coregonus clupeaformis TaxID=59861 RepID=UPI001E1C4441|nr:trichohyalin isoform X4 [Coregonus clupeaformis]